MITLTPPAAAKAVELLEREGLASSDYALRVAVQPGGCSGLRYQLYFDDRGLEGDTRIELSVGNEALTVVVDRMSLPYLDSAVIDFVDTIEKQGFAIDNPAATNSCACGDSFY